MTKVISIVNQKGGVGKTTTTINLASGLSELGKNILILDIDPQGNASTGLGVSLENRKITTYDLILEPENFQDSGIFETDFKNVHIIPATGDLASADMELLASERRSALLASGLRRLAYLMGRYDYILIDCPPSLSLLTINALVASHSALVPLQSEFFALEGLSQLMATIQEIRKGANPNLRIEGIVLTMFDARNNLAVQVEQDARENLGDLVFKTVIPRNVRLSEAPSFAMPALQYDPKSKGAVAYRALAQEMLDNNI